MAINADFRRRAAEGAIGRYRIVKPGAGVQSAVVATAATDLLLGTSDELPHVAGESIDLAVGKVPKVVLGGTVAQGEPITSDASGAGIKATATGQRYIGFAEISGVAGDEITYLRALGIL